MNLKSTLRYKLQNEAQFKYLMSYEYSGNENFNQYMFITYLFKFNQSNNAFMSCAIHSRRLVSYLSSNIWLRHPHIIYNMSVLLHLVDH